MDLEIRPITEEEYPAYARAVESAFGSVPTDQETEFYRQDTELDRTLAAFDDGDIVANAGSWAMEQTLPGLASIPVAGVTAVGVASTHRRRGLLTRMMDLQLDDTAARGESVAILTASESVIYGRFGYGWATSEATVAVEQAFSRFAQPVADPGRMRRVDAETARKALPALLERIRRQTPGDVTRLSWSWDRIAADLEGDREGAGPLFWAIHESASGEPDGMVRYRFKQEWNHGLTGSTLVVDDLMALTPEVEAVVFRYVLDVDLVRDCRIYCRPVDDHLRWRLADPRRYRVESVADSVWVRLVDIPAALAARRYTADGEVVVEVHDAFRPANDGRYVVEGGPEGAICARTTEDPDIAVAVDGLGAAYLGGVRFHTLAAAGRAEERKPGGLRRADAMFVSDAAPLCRSGF
jgi:predicted acetyltransferase